MLVGSIGLWFLFLDIWNTDRTLLDAAAAACDLGWPRAGVRMSLDNPGTASDQHVAYRAGRQGQGRVGGAPGQA